jgi:hypothetical protein
MGVNVTLYGGSAGFTSCQGGRGGGHSPCFLLVLLFLFPAYNFFQGPCSIPFRFSVAFLPASHPAPRRLPLDAPPAARSSGPPSFFSPPSGRSTSSPEKSRFVISPRRPSPPSASFSPESSCSCSRALPPPTGLSQTINERFRESRVTNCGARPLDFPRPRFPRRHRHSIARTNAPHSSLRQPHPPQQFLKPRITSQWIVTV